MTRDETMRARIRVDTNREIGRINPDIYGHFLEGAFYGNIEGGIFDEGSPLSDQSAGHLNGTRLDVIDACRELDIPVVRWPGGNYTSSYAWQDGIGPRDERPRRLDLNWGSEDSNRFGTDEFLAWCDAIGSEAYLAHSCRSVEDAVHWVEYTNYGGDTSLTRRRKANGRAEPWRVKYWGVGNEVYGPWQVGYRPAAQYAADAREHARFMRAVDPSIKTIGVGRESEEWTGAVLESAGPFLDYLSIHLYGGSHHLFTGDEQDNFDAVVAQSIHFEQQLRRYADMVATLSRKAGLDRPPSLTLDEWNMRHLEPAAWPDASRGERGGIGERETPPVDLASPQAFRVNRYSPRTLADALFYAGVLHALHRMAGVEAAPTMANTVNLVNANALLEVRPDGIVRSATWHVWKLLRERTGSRSVWSETESPGIARDIRIRPNPDAHGEFAARPGYVPYLDVSTTLDASGTTLAVSVINRHPEQPISAEIIVDGGTAPAPIRIDELGADATCLLGHNSMDEPETVSIREVERTQQDGGSYAFPPHALTVLTIDL